MVAQHLDIDPNGYNWQNKTIKYYLKGHEATLSDYNRTYNILLAKIGKLENKGTVDWAIEQVRELINSVTTEEDIALVRRMCIREYVEEEDEAHQ
jgi:hypothetical protein